MGIKLENLVVKFGDFKAINNVTLQIPKGKLVSLLGPSGSGKSTTLFTISGIHKVHSGKIFFGDKDVTGLEPEQLGIGLVFQNYALYPHMTVRENIMFPLNNLKWDKKKAAERVEEVAKIVKIADQLDKKPAQLSGGQQPDLPPCGGNVCGTACHLGAVRHHRGRRSVRRRRHDFRCAGNVHHLHRHSGKDHGRHTGTARQARRKKAPAVFRFAPEAAGENAA